MKVGYTKEGNKVIEYLPSNELYSKENRRLVFFKLYKYYVDEDMQLSPSDVKNGKNIYEVFQNKLKDKNISINLKKFIDNSQNNMLFDLNDMFFHLVYERAKKVNPHSSVKIIDDTIVIRDNKKDTTPTLLYVSYANIDKKTFDTNSILQNHIDKSAKIINETDIKQVYLVYPKHSEFKKHIQINLSEKVKCEFDEYRVKIIPYSFSFCTNNRLQGDYK